MGVDRAIDITAAQRKTVVALLERYLPGTAVWVYGSRAKWTSRPQSDLDLVVFAKPEQRGRVGDLREAFDESNLPFRVDLFAWNDVPDAFRAQIQDDHVVLADSKPPHTRTLDTAGEWNTRTIDEIKADHQYSIAIGPFGSRLKADRYTAGGVPVIRGNNISDTRSFVGDLAFVSEETADELRSSNAFPDDLVFPHRGTIGQVGIVPRRAAPRYVLSTSLMKLSCNKTLVDPLFVFYFFRSNQGREGLLQYASTVGTPGIGQPLTSLRSIALRVPPLPEQRAISHILGTLDDKIELNRRMNETHEATARALFKSWFVDFDPVRAKMAGRDTGLPKHVADFFPDRMVESELGELPEGWKPVPLPELIEVNPQRPLQRGKAAPYLNMANMPAKGHVPESVDQRPYGSGMRFANGDTLIARITPCLENGKTAYVDFLRDDEIGWGSTEYIVMKPITPLPNEFVYCLARSAKFREFAIQNMSGTSGRQRVPATALSRFAMPLPPVQLAAEFGRTTQLLLARANRAVRESRTLAAHRNALLPKLISGEMRVQDVQITL